ncbi:hypothetical protein AYL99_03758 [Fonsecaea erecta]|uniref:Uncharacterized protein n=1 Tax=Fonsecaea erecta TaxID=1367422 RepID=A0A178ZRD4_9EURO|nr:hypothetical protein AYL99_03758 [Fonsecaea erecta]OAP61555.1 hypothetical protein AYL99_03758 [Fonsecaea erecta]
MSTMHAFLANFNSGPGLGGLIQYACIGVNIMFLCSAIITSFASALADPFSHFNSRPYWMFTTFLSFAAVSGLTPALAWPELIKAVYPFIQYLGKVFRNSDSDDEHQASSNITITGAVSSRFRNIADSVPEPGFEDKRMLNLKTTFYLSVTLGGVFAVATAILALVWGRAAAESIAFVVPCAFGVLAVALDVAAIVDNFKRFKGETGAVELE